MNNIICISGWISALISFLILKFNKQKEKRELKEKLLENIEEFVNLSKNNKKEEKDFLIIREKILNKLEIYKIKKDIHTKISDELYILEYLIKNNHDYIKSLSTINNLIKQI